MAPWRLGNDYDRPIPRRIGEDVGRISRDLFGQQKMATVTEFPSPPVPVGTQLRREYFCFLREHRIVSPLWQWAYPLVHRINARIVFHTPHHYRYIYYTRRLLSKLVGRDINIQLFYRCLEGRLYCFCVNKRVKDHLAVLHGQAFPAGVPAFSPADQGTLQLNNGTSGTQRPQS